MKILVIFSGGLDSTTVLYHCKNKGHTVAALSFDYEQTHKRELTHACVITSELGVPHEVVKLHGVFGASALTDDKPMPTIDYSIESMRDTVVPNRNMVMLAIAVSKAIQMGFDAVAYGAHAGDTEVYPDCRDEFVQAMTKAIGICDWSKITLLAPLISMTKRQVVNYARTLSVPIEKTWSCYSGGDKPCGVCGACRSREESLCE